MPSSHINSRPTSHDRAGLWRFGPPEKRGWSKSTHKTETSSIPHTWDSRLQFQAFIGVLYSPDALPSKASLTVDQRPPRYPPRSLCAPWEVTIKDASFGRVFCWFRWLQTSYHILPSFSDDRNQNLCKLKHDMCNMCMLFIPFRFTFTLTCRLGLATWPSIFLETEAPINWSSFCDGRVEVEKKVQLLLCLHVVTCSTRPGFILITVNLCSSPISQFQVQISANRLVIWHVTWHHLHLLRQCFDGFLLGFLQTMIRRSINEQNGLSFQLRHQQDPP